jgi:CMP/dCMP kinase
LTKRHPHFFRALSTLNLLNKVGNYWIVLGSLALSYIIKVVSLCENVVFDSREFGAIAFAGPAKSGKSTIAEETAGLLGWDYFGAGVVFRQVCAENGVEVSGAAAADMSVHMGIERRMLEIMREKTRVILDGRTPALIVRENSLTNVLTVLVTSSLAVRADRAVQKSPEKYSNVKRAAKMLKSREVEDMEVFGKMYLWSYQDPDLYHIVIDSSEMTKKETMDNLLDQLTTM